jgi:hypothetical protein
MKLKITEEERKHIIDKYSDNTSQEVLNHLKREFPIYSHKLEWMDKPMKFITIDDKMKTLSQSKSFLVNVIYNSIFEKFPKLNEDVIRRTIKYYIDMNRVD